MTTKFKALIAGALVMCGASAFAVDGGTVTVNGMVTAETCIVNGNGGGSNNFTLTLPTISKSQLASVGAVAGATGFTIAVSGCTGGTATTMNTYFEPGPNVNSVGRLSDATGSSAGVDVQLLNSAFQPIVMGAANGSQNNSAKTLVGNAATQQFYAQYYATGAVTVGSFVSSFTYSMIYL